MSNAKVDTSETKLVKIVVNGEAREVPEGSDLAALLTFLKIDPAKVAIEMNRAIVRKKDWVATRVEAGAQLEIVWFVGGG